MTDSPRPAESARQIAYRSLLAVAGGAYADVALDRMLRRSQLSPADRRLTTELVYGCVRRQRSLDALIDRFASRPAAQQAPELRLLLHLGLYQLCWLDQIPDAAAVNTTVELAKQNRMAGLGSFVNGLLRRVAREPERRSLLSDNPDPVQRLGVRYSLPDWMVALWLEQLGEAEAERLCAWFEQAPHIDLRVNPLQSSREAVQAALAEAGVGSRPIPHCPQGLRLLDPPGRIELLPGYREGHWCVQDASAQLVAQLVDPQADETLIDACAAPGGKTTHLAELMGDRGRILAWDRTASRLRKVNDNARRLQLTCIETRVADSRELEGMGASADAVLVDAPCSGLGTLHRHADARWRQQPEQVETLAQLQGELLDAASTWVRPGGRLVYATCTLHPRENETVVADFLARHPGWRIQPPAAGSALADLARPEGWVKVWPQELDSDGFFLVQLVAD